jgi:hypothetical protein
MGLFLIVPILILIALAAPPAVERKSWLYFIFALVLSFAIVVLPLFVFFFSGFLLPDWKGDCPHGWLDCFMAGKIALAPLALVATAALYSVEVLKIQKRAEKWIVLSIFSGAVVAVTCLLIGVICFGTKDNFFRMFLLVPLYVAVWYTYRAWQLARESGVRPGAYLVTLLGSFPLWVASVIISKSAYTSLPNQPPDCFIVTAASRGHRKFVGPFFEVHHHGRRRQANQQLVTLWQLEDLWRTHSQRSHGCLRWFYNRLGPMIAARIRSPWLADLAYAAIKPVELAAKAAIWASKQNKGTQNER